jgi:putative membrane protein
MTVLHRRYPLILIFLFLVEWIVLAINPNYRDDWLLENVLVVIAAIVLFGFHKRMGLSHVSYTLIFIFLCLHVIGSHYTYAEVPYDQWVISLTGGSLNGLLGWERNNYDRVIHFSFGLLLVYPVRTLFLRALNASGFLSYFLPQIFMMAAGMFYELIEWAAALLFGGGLGMAYLGTQGDVWDGHKDMALSSLGSLITLTSLALFNEYSKRLKSA